MVRILLKASFPVETVNAAFKDGSFADRLQSILTDLKPEAAYFIANEKGQRAAYLVLDLADPSKIPAVGEPFFLAFNAAVELYPAMVHEDPMKAGPAIEQAVKKYAR
jgi:hypothetical protein